MEWIATIPVWLLCLLIFVLRICDVTLGTVRTVSIVKGYIGLSVVLGFFEVMIWILAVSQVIVRLGESWLLPLCYAGGFAVGNAIGILVERRLALGTSVVRFLSATRGAEIARVLQGDGHTVTTFSGEGPAGPVTLVYAVAPRRDIRPMVRSAQAVDPELAYVSEPAHESNTGVQLRLRPVPNPTGWRSILKKK